VSDLDKMIGRPASWLSGEGPDNEIVLSTRVRLARNVGEHRFTQFADTTELASILEAARDAASNAADLESSSYYPMGNVAALDRQLLAERHLISRDFLFNSANRGLLVNEPEDLSVMINEEDHLRIQAFAPGFDLTAAYERSNRLDSSLASGLGFAFSEKLGYLTACPTNLGTGMRASVLIHVPGLVHSKEIHKLLDSLRQLNHSIRGFYGEGSESMGNFFQLSNSATLGSSEDDIIGGLKEMVMKVIGYEQRSRDMLYRKARSLLEDKVWRAYGLLQYSRSVSSKEALSLISAVRLGIGMGIIEDLSIRTLNELLIYIHPAHLQKLDGRQMDTQERDVARAAFIRRTVTGMQSHEED